MSKENNEIKNEKETYQLIEKQKPQMSLVLPSHMDTGRMARMAFTEYRKTPKLKECDPHSFIKCVMIAAQLGLEPGLMGHVYFVPYKTVCNVIIGYRGMIDLARRSGQIKSIEARVVGENDICEIRYGTDAAIHHLEEPKKDRGEVIGYYAVAQLVGGGKQFEFMRNSDVEAIRKESPSKNSTPWVKYYNEMAKKTVIRRLFKYLPVSIEMNRAVSIDELGDAGLQKEAIDGEFNVEEKIGGEIEEKKDSQSDALAEQLK